MNRSLGRDAQTGAWLLSTHDDKIFDGPAERSVRLKSGSFRVIAFQIRVPSFGTPIELRVPSVDLRKTSDLSSRDLSTSA